MTDRRKEDKGIDWPKAKIGEWIEYEGNIRNMRIDKRSGIDRRQRNMLEEAKISLASPFYTNSNERFLASSINILISMVEKRGKK